VCGTIEKADDGIAGLKQRELLKIKKLYFQIGFRVDLILIYRGNYENLSLVSFKNWHPILNKRYNPNYFCIAET
jgi:hypothetical protein